VWSKSKRLGRLGPGASWRGSRAAVPGCGSGTAEISCQTHLGQSQVVGRRDIVNEHSNIVLASKRGDRGAGIGRSWLSDQTTGTGNVTESSSNAGQFPGGHQAVENLVNRSARSEIGEVLRVPAPDLPPICNAISDGGSNDGWRSRRKSCLKVVAIS
jgi:hypothetical protein